jgi:hypothetical protein
MKADPNADLSFLYWYSARYYSRFFEKVGHETKCSGNKPLFTKIHSFFKQCFSFHEKKTFQLMSDGLAGKSLVKETLFY